MAKGVHLLPDGCTWPIIPEVSELWAPSFVPAAGCGTREPEWFVIRYVAGRERSVFRLVDFLKLRYRAFGYRFKIPRTRHRKSYYTTRQWMPGYFFIEFDVAHDFWQQLLYVPHVLEILGNPSPLPKVGSGSVVDLEARLPPTPEGPTTRTSIRPGTLVRIEVGPFAHFVGPVLRSDKRAVVLLPMVFGRPTELTVPIKDATVIG